jgi:trimeric autotransporter adhesin
MGSVNLDNTGSGSAITLSSDGTSLLLDGTAIGGGGGDPDLYADNWDGTAIKPSATGVNTIAIGQSAVAGSSDDGIAIGRGANAGTSTQNMAIGAFSACGDAAFAVAFGREAKATGGNSMALGKGLASNTSSLSAQITNNTTTYGATGGYSIAMGYQSKSTNTGAQGIGYLATASGLYSVSLGGGNGSTASGTNSFAWGTFASASTTYAVAFGAFANATHVSAVSIGNAATSNSIGKLTFANGAADHQTGFNLLRQITADATAEQMTTNNSTATTDNGINVQNNAAFAFSGTIVGKQAATANCAAWKVEGLIVNNGGTTTLVNSAVTVLNNAPAWGMALT